MQNIPLKHKWWYIYILNKSAGHTSCEAHSLEYEYGNYHAAPLPKTNPSALKKKKKENCLFNSRNISQFKQHFIKTNKETKHKVYIKYKVLENTCTSSWDKAIEDIVNNTA